MKRFYGTAAVATGKDRIAVELDGRPVRTPERQDLTFPTRALADASAAEWNRQEDELDMAAMPMTAFCYAAIDRIGRNMEQFAEETARFAETDLLCYRAPGPAALRARQAAVWDPILAWLKAQRQAPLTIVEGIMPVTQPKASLQSIRKAFGELDAFQLTAAHSVARIVGSAGITLAVMAGELDAAAAAEAADIDDAFQLEKWGEDEAARALINRRHDDLVEVGRFLQLLRQNDAGSN